MNNVNITDIPKSMMIDVLQSIIDDIKTDTSCIESYSIKFTKHHDECDYI